MDHGLIFVGLAFAVGLWMTWGVGANDLANVMSTAIGSKAITVRQAIIIAIVFEIAGAFVGGNQVTATIREGVINTQHFHQTPILLVYSMLSVLFAVAIWITTASYIAMPVSITNAVVGALVGVAAIMLGMHAVHWQTVGYIAISWISSPAIAGILAYLLFISIKRSILGKENPLPAAQRYIPVYLFLVGIVLAMMTTLKIVNHFHLYNKEMRFFLVLLTAFIILTIGVWRMKLIRFEAEGQRHLQFLYIENRFSVLMAFTACAMVFAHGSNDVAIAVGPVAAIVGSVVPVSSLHHSGLMNSLMLFGCLGVVLGLFMYGRKVIETVGSQITTLTPSRAFAATLAAASVVAISTTTGIPVSATQTLVGAVLGVGLARGIDALNLHVIRNIFMSWVITIPVSAGLAVLFFFLLKKIFG